MVNPPTLGRGFISIPLTMIELIAPIPSISLFMSAREPPGGCVMKFIRSR